MLGCSSPCSTNQEQRRVGGCAGAKDTEEHMVLIICIMMHRKYTYCSRYHTKLSFVDRLVSPSVCMHRRVSNNNNARKFTTTNTAGAERNSLFPFLLPAFSRTNQQPHNKPEKVVILLFYLIFWWRPPNSQAEDQPVNCKLAMNPKIISLCLPRICLYF